MRLCLRVLLLLVVVFLSIVPPSYAADEEMIKDGKRYGLTEKEIEKQEERESNCGMTGVGCKINAFFVNAGEQLLKLAMKLLDSFVLNPKKVVEKPTFEEYFKYFKDFSWSLLTLFFLFHLVRILATSITQDNMEFKMLLRKLVLTAALMGSIPWIVESLLKMNNWFVRGVINNDDFKLSKFMGGMIGASALTSVSAFLILLWAVFMIILAIQFSIRFAKIAFLFIVGPFAVATNLNNEYNLFPAWWKDLLTTIFTQAIQILLLALAMKTIGEISLNDLTNFVAGVGFIFLILKTPSFLKEWMWSSGAGGMTQRAGGAAVGMVRSMVTRRMAATQMMKANRGGQK